MGDVEPDRIAGFERGALREEERQAGKAGFADRIDVGIAGDDISELGFERRVRHVGLGVASCARACTSVSASTAKRAITAAAAAREPRGMSRWMPPPRKSTTSVSSRNSDKRGEENRAAQVLRLAGAVDFMAGVASGEKSSGARRSAEAAC